MADILTWAGGGLAVLGALLTVVGALGVIRFPDAYTRIHAASITDTGGATVMLLGLCLMSGASPVTVKLLIVWGVVMITSPTAAHTLANAAYSSGLKPRVGAFSVMSGRRDAEEADSEAGKERGE